MHRITAITVSTLLPLLTLGGCCCYDSMLGAYQTAQGTSSEAGYVWVSAAMDYTCALQEDGAITCWGCEHRRSPANEEEYDADRGQCDAPEGAFVAVETAEEYACGLREDGLVTCWGMLEFRSTSRTPTVAGFEAIAIGQWNACGLRGNGELECWGCKPGSDSPECVPPEGTFRSVAAGPSFHCALDTSGLPSCWAWPHAEPSVLTTLPQTPFDSVTLGEDGGCGVHMDGTAECWGKYPGVLDGTFDHISCGEFLCCGVTLEGTLRCWMEGASRELWEPDLGGALANQVSVGYEHGCVITSDNHVTCFGFDNQGQSSPP